MENTPSSVGLVEKHFQNTKFCITGLCEVEGSNCCSPLGVTYLSGFNGVLVFLLFLELNSHALPDLESPCHWQRVLGQVVYSNKAYLQVLDIPAIHLGSLSRRIVNIHPQSVPAGTLPCVCRVLLSLSGRKS